MFKKVAAGLGLLTAGLYLYDLIKDIDISNPFARAKRNKWLSASTLQLSGPDMIGRVSNPGISDYLRERSYRNKKQLQATQEEGTATHRMVQRQLEAQGLGQSEYYLEDTANKVFGHADFMLNGGIPMEIKTVAPGTLFKLSQPKKQHVSQLNFDMMASKSNSGYLMYVERNDPTNRKVFAMAPDPSLYASDVGRGRQYQKTFGNLPTPSPYLSGFRPITSLFQTTNDVPVIMNRSRYSGQKQRLANLPAYQMSISPKEHPNQKGRSNGYS